jgi:hypothetical protein
LQNFFHWYIPQSWKLKRPQIPQMRLYFYDNLISYRVFDITSY